jgi:hypothetical protein
MDEKAGAEPLSTRIHRHLRSNVYGLVAIFIALGGTGYAATQLPKDSVRSRHIEDRQVKGADLATGAIASGKVERRSLNGSDLGGNTIRARQLDDSALFARTKIVDPAGTPSQNGSDLLAAVDSISGSGPATPYLVQLGPGEYDLGGSILELPDSVELAGAGPGVTTVTSTNSDATVNAGSADEVRDLAIEASGAASRALGAGPGLTVYDASLSAQGNGATAVFVGGNESIRIRDSEITASSTGAQAAIAIDVDSSGTTTLDRDRIAATTASGSGVATAVSNRGNGSTLTVRGSTVEASGPAGSDASALATTGGASITADASSVSGTTASLNNGGNSTSTIRVGGSKLSGPVAIPGFGTVTCVLSYSASYASLSSACN